MSCSQFVHGGRARRDVHHVTRRYFLYASIRALAQVVRRPVPSGAVDLDAVAMEKDGAREPLSLAS